MARSFNGTSDNLSHAAGVITAASFSVSAWTFPDTTNANRPIVTLDDGVVGLNVYRFYFSNAASGALRMQTVNSPSSATVTTANTATTGAWNHIVGGEVSAASRFVRLNGGTKATETTSVTPVGINKTEIGAEANGGDYFDGLLAEVALWSVALDDDEQLALSKGICPLLIRPQSLAGYWPLLGNDGSELDRWKSRFDMTVTGATKADHPRIYYPWQAP